VRVWPRRRRRHARVPPESLTGAVLYKTSTMSMDTKTHWTAAGRSRWWMRLEGLICSRRYSRRRSRLRRPMAAAFARPPNDFAGVEAKAPPQTADSAHPAANTARRGLPTVCRYSSRLGRHCRHHKIACFSVAGPRSSGAAHG
jgi:hypothetical protein